MNTDTSRNMLADLPAVKTLQNYVPHQRSHFSLLARLLVTIPRPPVESLVEDAQHTDTLLEQMSSLEETGKAKPITLRRETRLLAAEAD